MVNRATQEHLATTASLEFRDPTDRVSKASLAWAAFPDPTATQAYRASRASLATTATPERLDYSASLETKECLATLARRV